MVQPTFMGNMRQKGLGAFAKGFGSGAMSSVGFTKEAGSWKFGVGGSAAGVLLSAFSGSQSNGVMGAAIGGGLAAKFGMGTAFTGLAIMEGIQQEGLWGGIKGGARATIEWGLFEGGMAAISAAAEGTALAGIGAAIGTVAYPLAFAAGAGYGAYKAAGALAAYGRKQRNTTEFVGDTRAFRTQAAMTMRQRSLNEIQRSHTNGRTLLGNEANYLHLR